MSSTKVKAKGLLKGFKYISHVFDEKEEDTIQIGFPTDVKHVAHIGWDGPSASAPTWMTEFKTNSDTEVSSKAEVVKSTETHEDKKDKTSTGLVVRKSKDIPKSRHISIDDQPKSPTKKSFDEKKHTRRHRSTDTSSENSTREKIGGTRHTRRHRHSKNEGELPSQDGVAVPKQTRRRKKNLSIDDDSVRSSASSMTDI